MPGTSSQAPLYILNYYASQSRFTDPGRHADSFARLPLAVADLCHVVRGLVVHYLAAEELHGYSIPRGRLGEVDTRYVAKMLARIIELAPSRLTVPRPPDRRLVGCCHDFALLLCAMLRRQGIPARTRVGLATYLQPGFNVDHEIVEVWDADRGAWRLVDPSVSDRHIERYGSDFDQHNVPRNRFIVGALAWRMSRTGMFFPNRLEIDPNLYADPIQNSVVRDLAALNKMEMLLWDRWGLIGTPQELVDDKDRVLLDFVARLILIGDPAFDQLRELFEKRSEFRVPRTVKTYSPVSQPRKIELVE